MIIHFAYFAALFWWFFWWFREWRSVFFQRKDLLWIPWVHCKFQFSGKWLWILLWAWDKTNKYCPEIHHEASESPIPVLGIIYWFVWTNMILFYTCFMSLQLQESLNNKPLFCCICIFPRFTLTFWWWDSFISASSGVHLHFQPCSAISHY